MTHYSLKPLTLDENLIACAAMARSFILNAIPPSLGYFAFEYISRARRCSMDSIMSVVGVARKLS